MGKKKIEPIQVTVGPNALLTEQEQFNQLWVYRDDELLLEMCQKINEIIERLNNE